MDSKRYGKITSSQKSHKAGVSAQTGFPSPATHYIEPTIDLNEVLIGNRDATFFIRVKSDCEKFQLYKDDVLIVDRSRPWKAGKLALVVKNGEFKIVRTVENDYEKSTLWGMIGSIIHML